MRSYASVVNIQSPGRIQGGLLHAYLPDIQFSERVQYSLLSPDSVQSGLLTTSITYSLLMAPRGLLPTWLTFNLLIGSRRSTAYLRDIQSPGGPLEVCWLPG
jgi:hypothetical protein